MQAYTRVTEASMMLNKTYSDLHPHHYTQIMCLMRNIEILIPDLDRIVADYTVCRPLQRTHLVGEHEFKLGVEGSLAGDVTFTDETLTWRGNHIVFWDHAHGDRAFRAPVHSLVAIFPSKERVVIGYNRKLTVWDLPPRRHVCLSPRRHVCTFRGHEKPLRCVVVFSDNNRIASCSADGTMRIWDVNKQTCSQQISIKSEHVSHMSVYPNGKRIVLQVPGVPFLEVWGVESGCLCKVIYVSESIWTLVKDINIFPDNRHLALSLQIEHEGVIRVFDMEVGDNGKCVHQHNESLKFDQVTVSSNGSIICRVDNDQSFRTDFQRKVFIWQST